MNAIPQKHLGALKNLVIGEHKISSVVTNVMVLLHIQFTKLKPQNLNCPTRVEEFF